MKARPAVPLRPLLVLTVVVFVLHGLALREAPATFAWTEARPKAPMNVRAVAGPAIAAPAAAQAEPQAPQAAPAHDGPRPRAAKPQPRGESATQAAANTPALAAVAVPGAARWHYRVSALHRGVPVDGRAELEWWHDGQRYEAALRIDAPPLPARLQRSAGELHAGGLAPLRFSERLRTEEAAHFDHQAARIVFSANTAPAPLRAGAQDRLSVLLQLGALLAARPQGWSAGDALVLQTATTREAGEWRFTVEGEETLDLPETGPTAALRLSRAPRHEWDPRLEVWFVPGADYGPARLRLTPANGDWLDMQWSGTDKR